MSQRLVAANRTRFLLVCSFVLIFSFSAHRPSYAETVCPPDSKHHKCVPADHSTPISLLYFCLADHTPLLPSEVAALIAEADAQHEAKLEHWFMQIHTRIVLKTEPRRIFVRLYYAPDWRAERIRRGSGVNLVVQRYTNKTFDVVVRNTFRYAQVSPPWEVFEDNLPIPIPRDLPIAVSDDISDGDVIALHDCARGGARHYGFEAHADTSPLSFDTSDLSSVEAYLGHGSGISLFCLRQGEAYVPFKDTSVMGGWIAD